MNPSKLAPGITFNTTESMAEWAWRYGEAGIRHRDFCFGILMFDDGSIMDFGCVYNAISWRFMGTAGWGMPL